ncbi:MAG: hypothetical protein K2X82_16400 [Gemmataceae bacterium]|nr:hypothetical protein [Gemmataceae bacterium]
MEYPFPVIDPPFLPKTADAADTDFPVRITKRARRALYWHLVTAQPYRGPCLRIHLADGGPAVRTCDADVIRDPDYVVSRFGTISAGVHEDDIDGLRGCVLDRYCYPPGMPVLAARRPGGPGDGAPPGRLRLSLPKVKAVHPELFRRPSVFTAAAGLYLTARWWFAQADGPPGWLARRVALRDQDGQAQAIEGLAGHLWRGEACPAVAVSADPPVVAAYSDEFDHVTLLRVPRSWGLKAGARLVACNTYDVFPEAEPDVAYGPAGRRVWNSIWPVLADPITDDADRLAALKAGFPPARWDRVQQAGDERLRNGDRPRDGRPWLSQVPAALQKHPWLRWPGGYLR